MKREERTKQLGYRFRVVDKLIQRYFSTRMVNDGKELTRMQCGTIRYLIENDDREVFQKDFEKDFAITGATATNILKLMEKGGIIERVPLKRDGRLKKLVLTQKGYQLDAKAQDNIERLEIGMLKGISEEDVAIFSDVMERITQNIVDLIEERQREN